MIKYKHPETGEVIITTGDGVPKPNTRHGYDKAVTTADIERLPDGRFKRKDKVPMKAPANPVLEAILETAAEIEVKTRTVMSELGPKIKDQETRKAAAERKAAGLFAELEASKADYVKAWAQVEADERKSIESKALMLKAVEAGQVSMAEYLERGQDAVQIAAQARVEADRKMAELAGIVRAKGRAVIQAELEVAEATAELTYLFQAPGIYLLESVKEFLKGAEARVLAIDGGFLYSAQARDKKRDELAQVNGRAVSGSTRKWPLLDEKGLRQLRLDPHIYDAWLPELDRIIASMAGSPDVVDVVVYYSGDACRERIEFRSQQAQQIMGSIRGMTLEEVKP